MEKNLFFYVASGERYIKEAAVSALRIKLIMPDVPCALVTPNVNDEYKSLFDIILQARPYSSELWFLSQVYYTKNAIEDFFEAGFRYIIYLDTDTYICYPVYELFDMLKYFDFMGVHAPGRFTTNTVQDIPPAFPELNIGVNPMRIGNIINTLWSDMFEWYNTHYDIYGNNDQGALRDILWRYSLFGRGPRVYILPPEYNFRFGFACFASHEVKILHGRSNNIRAVSDRANQSKGMRSWKSGQLE